MNIKPRTENIFEWEIDLLCHLFNRLPSVASATNNAEERAPFKILSGIYLQIKSHVLNALAYRPKFWIIWKFCLLKMLYYWKKARVLVFNWKLLFEYPWQSHAKATTDHNGDVNHYGSTHFHPKYNQCGAHKLRPMLIHTVYPNTARRKIWSWNWGKWLPMFGNAISRSSQSDLLDLHWNCE